VDGDGLAGLITLAEIVALQYASHRVLGHQLDEIRGIILPIQRELKSMQVLSGSSILKICDSYVLALAAISSGLSGLRVTFLR